MSRLRKYTDAFEPHCEFQAKNDKNTHETCISSKSFPFKHILYNLYKNEGMSLNLEVKFFKLYCDVSFVS